MTSPLLKLFLLITSIISSNNAYYISLHALEWANASIWCQSYCSSHLASIHSTNDHLTMLDLIDRNPYIYTRVWIGLNDIQTSDIWQWSDGTLFDFGNIKDPITGFLAPGTYPWRSDEPDYNDSDECVVYEVGSNYPPNANSRQWTDRKKTGNYHFACNSCSGRLHKYAAVNIKPSRSEPYNYSYAQDQCQYFFGTSLASIHSDNDMMEARITCKQLTFSVGCWIGLKKVGNVYQWVDGTEWDYGQTLHQWPWYVSSPGAVSDQLCIFLDPDNGNDPGDYLWDDFWCNDRGPNALCNAPSEICDAGQWFIAKGKETDYIFTESPCELTKTVMDKQSVAILWDKQYFNSLGTLSVEMMYSITDIIHDGNVGVVFYFDETNCDNYYYIGIWPGYQILFIGKSVNDEWTLLTYKDIGFVYNMGTFYALKIDLTAGTMWTISLNTIPLITNYIDDSFNNWNNKLSGYIGIRNVNASFIVKSLFISGDVQYFDNSWYFGCTEPPTNMSSINPTINPSKTPTSYPTGYPSVAPTEITSSPALDTTLTPSTYNPSSSLSSSSIAPTFPWDNTNGAPIASPNKLECIITPPAKDSCAGTIQTAVNPDINWELLCGGLGSCYESTIMIVFTPSAMPIELKGFFFTNNYAAAGATIIINNPTGRRIRIAEVKCDRPYSCQHATFITGPDAFIQQGDFFCNAVGSCDNCWVKINAMDPGLSCTHYVRTILI